MTTRDESSELVALRSQVETLKAERDALRFDLQAHHALNRAQQERIEEIERDNEFQGEYLGKLEGIVNGTGSTGHIKWDLDTRIRKLVELQAAVREVRADLLNRVKWLQEQRWRGGHYDDYGAGQEERAQKEGDFMEEIADRLAGLDQQGTDQTEEPHEGHRN